MLLLQAVIVSVSRPVWGQASLRLHTCHVNHALFPVRVDFAPGSRFSDLLCAGSAVIYRHTSPAVLVPALRTVGNIVTGNDMQTQVVINCGALNCLLTLLTANHKKSIKKEACWTISNITAGTKEQIQAVIQADIMPPLVALLQVGAHSPDTLS